MPIAGQTALTTITIAKEQKITYQPVCIVQLDMVDGTHRYFSPENFSSTMAGHPYKGLDWQPRILDETLGQIQSVTDTGIIQLPQITIKLADADKELWLNDEVGIPGFLAPGYDGAKLTLKFIFWDPDTNTFSTDEQVKFVGTCNPPRADHESLTITAVNILNLANFNLPTARIQRTCIWVFPRTHDDRVSGSIDITSDFYGCHYCPDVTDADYSGGTANARGNIDPSTGQPFIDCDYTWQGCIARMGNIANTDHTNSPSTKLQIEFDQAGRQTGTFSGIHFDPPEDWRGREYTSGNTTQNINNPNDAKFSDYFPTQYGAGFTSPPVMSVTGDANSTKFEVVLGIGPVDRNTGIQLVVVNDIVVPARAQSQDPTILGWSWVNNGNVFGTCNRDTLFDGRGDPYGGLIAISIVVPTKVQASNAIPNVRVLWAGQFTTQFIDTMGNFNRGSSNNPVWSLYDLLTVYCSLDSNSLDIQSFLDAAPICDQNITYTDLTGNTAAQHPRYQLGICLRERRSALEVVNNVLASFKALLQPNSGVDPTRSGKLQLKIKQTLADQQPNPIPGSNDPLQYPSAHADGSETGVYGYLAYHFHEGDILRKGPDRDTPSTFTIEQRTIQDTPSIIGIDFQDQDYQYTTDSLTVVDSNKIGRSKQQVSGGVAAEGILNFDQGKRVIQTQFAEQFRGNPRSGNIIISGEPQDDSGGTWIATFETSFKAVHLNVGDIIGITYADYGLDAQQFRILAISPMANFERITIRAQWHEDDWYLDSYGQVPDPILQAQRKHRLNRPPFGWLPDETAPLSTDTMVDPTEKSFALQEDYEAAADGTAISNVIVRGREPVNNFTAQTAPPYAPILEAFDTGGSVGDGVYYAQLVATDAAGNSSAPSYPVSMIALNGSSGNGSLTIPNIYWQSGTTGWKLYAGKNPNKLSLQSTGTGTPSSINLSTFKAADLGEPDVEFDHLEVRVQRVRHSGIIGAGIIAVRPTEIDIAAIPGVDLTGRYASILGRLNANDDMPIWNFLIASNSGFTLVISGVTDLTALTPAPKIGDVLVIRTAPDTVTSTTIGDSLFINSVNYYNPPFNIVDATNATPIIIETDIAHNYSNGDNVFVQNVSGNDGANGTFNSIVVIDSTHIQLTGSVGTGAYGGGGTVQEITNGLEPHTEIGNYLFIAFGTGRFQWRKITDNDRTSVTVDPPWGVTPDSTSKFIILEPNTIATVDTQSIVNADPLTETTLTIPVDNYLERVLWIQGFTESADGKESILQDSPGRELYVFGGPGTANPNFDKATFNIAVVADLVVGNDVDVPLIVRRAGTPVDCTAKIKVPSVGADVHIDIILTKKDGSYTGTIFNTGVFITLPAGSTSLVDVTNFKPGIKFDEGDIMTVNVTQIGSTQPGRTVAIVVKYILT